MSIEFLSFELSNLVLWTLGIAVVTSVVCALCGSLLLVRGQAMVSEGLSHAIYPGLVLAFMLLRSYSSPLLIIAAAVSGLVMVWLTQWLKSTRLVDSDAGLGIVFAGMFSFGILLVSVYMRNVHFHTDCVIVGNLALAPLDDFYIRGVYLGPQSWVVMLVMLTICISFIAVCYKELKLMLFDPLLAQRFGLKPHLLEFIWLAIVSLTTVAAFNVAGAVLIVALMIAPPAAAYLLTDRLSWLLVISSGIAIISSMGGFFLALELDIAPTGPIASTAGAVFLLVFAFAPKRGFIAAWARRIRQHQETIDCLILDALARQTSGSMSFLEAAKGLDLPAAKINRAMARLQEQQMVQRSGDHCQLTDQGTARLAAFNS